MTDFNDMDTPAAEFVLGTLDHVERRRVATERATNPTLDAAVLAWERRLAPLNGAVVDVAPPPAVLTAIEERIGRLTTRLKIPAADPAHTSATIHAPERRVVRWRRTAAAMSAMAAALLIAVGIREANTPAQPESFVAVFHKDDAQPSFVLSIDLVSRELTIRPVTADRQGTDKTYQLWILADQLGPVPKSLGLLDGAVEPTRKRLSEFDPALLQRATFGISLEPAGGSPTGRPTGSALHGRLIPSTP